MAVSWRQTVQKPCMPTTPPSDTPALLWSHQDCPENQKHLLCLSDKHTPHHLSMHNKHRTMHTKLKTHKIQILRCTEHTFSHVWIHRYTSRRHHLILLLPPASSTGDKEHNNNNNNNNNICGVNSSEVWPSHLPAAINIFLKSQHRLWAVNKSDRLWRRWEKKMPIKSESKGIKVERQQSYFATCAIISGQCWQVVPYLWQRPYYEMVLIVIMVKLSCLQGLTARYISSLKDQETVILSIQSASLLYCHGPFKLNIKCVLTSYKHTTQSQHTQGMWTKCIPSVTAS